MAQVRTLLLHAPNVVSLGFALYGLWFGLLGDGPGQERIQDQNRGGSMQQHGFAFPVQKIHSQSCVQPARPNHLGPKYPPAPGIEDANLLMEAAPLQANHS